MNKSIQTLALTFISLAPFTAQAADGVLYCSAQDVEGAALKVESAKGRLCYGAGPLGADYCDRPNALILPIVRQSEGTVATKDGKPVSYREFVGQSEGKLQVVRVFNETAFPTAAEVIGLWAEFYGTSLNLSAPASFFADPGKVEAKAGDPTCLEGDDDSF